MCISGQLCTSPHRWAMWMFEPSALERIEALHNQHNMQRRLTTACKRMSTNTWHLVTANRIWRISRWDQPVRTQSRSRHSSIEVTWVWILWITYTLVEVMWQRLNTILSNRASVSPLGRAHEQHHLWNHRTNTSTQRASNKQQRKPTYVSKTSVLTQARNRKAKMYCDVM